MAEFRHVEHATFSPTECMLCGDHQGPFIDTGVERDPYGHIWICASTERRIGCVRQMGRLDGLYEPQSVQEIHDRIATALHQLEPAFVQEMTEKLSRANALVDQLAMMVEELAKQKLVPALEVYEMGKRSIERERADQHDPALD